MQRKKKSLMCLYHKINNKTSIDLFKYCFNKNLKQIVNLFIYTKKNQLCHL